MERRERKYGNLSGEVLFIRIKLLDQRGEWSGGKRRSWRSGDHMLIGFFNFLL
jgi:hypothetical protein